MSGPEQMTLAWVAEVLGLPQADPSAVVESVVIDSRKVVPGALFVALAGARTDGHAFVEVAAQAGAVAALVERRQPTDLPQLVVADVRRALAVLATAWRARFTCPVIALTGSNGKTTTKELLAAILARKGPVLATEGNLNNDLGVPLTLLRLRRRHQFAVIEQGANHVGEIAELTTISRPDIALITNAGPAHLEGFGSLEGVARGKGEIYAGLGPNGVAVINADDRFATYWREVAAPRRVVACTLESIDAELRGSWCAHGEGGRVDMTTPVGRVTVDIALQGRHNGMNALLASACAWVAGADLHEIHDGLANVQPVGGRLNRQRGPHGCSIIDDTYNANPASMGAALALLAERPGRRIAALGDMGELGAEAEVLHRELGRRARALGIDALYACGPLSRATVEGFGEQGFHFDDHAALAAALRAQLAADVTVLAKGSRSAGMERVVALLQAEEEVPCSTC